MKKLLIVTGELSGFNYGKEIAKKLKNFLEIYGVFLEDIEGTETLINAKEITAFGLFEAIGKLPAIGKALKKIEKFIKEKKPDAVLLIDFPGFNMKVAEIAKKHNTKVLYFISPKFWAWNYKRGEKLVKIVDRMFVIFPFEVELYKKLGFEATYVGNPLTETIKPSLSKEEFFNKYDINDEPILLMPGSRPSEIKYLLQPLCETAKKINENSPSVFILPVAKSLPVQEIKSKITNIFPEIIPIDGKDVYNGIRYSQFGIIASGTASLECAIGKLPHIVVYKLNPLTFLIAKRVVKIPFISLPNIIANEKIVEEILQKDVNPDNLLAKFKENLKEKEEIKRKIEEKIIPRLKGNAIENLCEEVLKELRV